MKKTLAAKKFTAFSDSLVQKNIINLFIPTPSRKHWQFESANRQ
jgi:hypothetical protein